MPSPFVRVKMHDRDARPGRRLRSWGTSLVRGAGLPRVAGVGEAGGELGPVAGPELGEGGRDVALDRLAGEEELARDLGVRGARRGERRDLPLALGQRTRAARPAGPGADAEAPQVPAGEDDVGGRAD